MVLENSNETALFCIKNMGYNLDDNQAKRFHQIIDYTFIQKVSSSDQGLLILRQACGVSLEAVQIFSKQEQADWLYSHLGNIMCTGKDC